MKQTAIVPAREYSTLVFLVSKLILDALKDATNEENGKPTKVVSPSTHSGFKMIDALKFTFSGGFT